MAMESKKIKWRRLKRIAETIANRPVTIHCSTEVPLSLKAAADIYDERIDIVFNLQHIKSEEDILRALSHELTHVITAGQNHNQDFDTTWAQIYTELQQKYFKK